MNLVVTAVVLSGATAVSARPTIHVVATIDHADRSFRDRLAWELDARHLPETPEQYLAEQFVEVFSALRMFEFTTDASPGSALTLRLRLSSGAAQRRWPQSDLSITLELSSGNEHPITRPLFRRAVCREPNTPCVDRARCVPGAFVDARLYRCLFGEILQQWPRGMLHSVVLASSASYEPGGTIRTIEPLSDFGQIHGGIPDALFEILFGTTQRPFAFCLEDRHGRWRALGRDQGSAPVIVPSCDVGAVAGVPGGSNGRVTLLKAFPELP